MEIKQDRECMCDRNVEVRSRNLFCHGRAVSITYSECVSVALGIQHAMRMRLSCCHMWSAWLYNIFFHIIS